MVETNQGIGAGRAGGIGDGGSSRGLGQAEAREAQRQADAFGVTVTDNRDGTVTVSAPPRDGQHGYSVTVTPLEIDPSPAQLGAMARSQADTAARQGQAIKAEIAEKQDEIRERVRDTMLDTGVVPTDAAVERAARKAADWPDTAVLVSAAHAGSQRAADIQTAQRYAEAQGFAGSNRDRIAAVAASARTGFAVPAETFAIDPHHGLAGAGHVAAPLSGSGGMMSDTGIAHDTDYFVGYHTGKGPMGAIADIRAATGRDPSGLHGLNLTQNVVSYQEGGAARLAQMRAEQQAVTDTQRIPQYDALFGDLPQGWDITMIAPRGVEPHPGFGAGRIAR